MSTTDKKSHFEKVQEFAEAFEVKKYEGELVDIFDTDLELIKFRFSLINEEVNELVQAVKDKDFVEIYDSIEDILYVAFGMYVALNINADNQLYTTQCCTVTQDDVQKNVLYLLADETLNYVALNKNELSSNDTWYALQSLSILAFGVNLKTSKYDIFTNQRMVDYRVCNIVDERNIMVDAIDRRNIHDVLGSLASLTYNTYVAAAAFGIDINSAFNIVHKSNMSKLCISEEEAQKTVEYYKSISPDSPKYYDSPAYRESKAPGKWIVYNESTSKVLKSINYTPADFSTIL